jgi:hypothetical protein
MADSLLKNVFVPPSPTVALNQLSVANANTDGTTGTYVTLKTAAANGSAVYSVDIFALSTTTAGKIRFFLSDGTNTRLVDEVLVTAIAPSNTTIAFKTTWTPPSGVVAVPTGWVLKASTINGETFNLVVKGSDN